MKRLSHDLSNASEKSMAKERLDMLFRALWPRLKAEVAEAKVVDGIRRIQREVHPKLQILPPNWGSAR